MLDQRRTLWVGNLGFASARVQITQRGRHWVEALLQPPVKTLFDFFPEISAVIRGNDRLHVSGKHPAWGSQIERLRCKMDLDAGFHELADLGPIFQVSGRAVDLMDDYAFGLALLQEPKHFVEYWTPDFGCRFATLKPSGNLKILALGVALNCFLLLRKRNTAFALSRRRDADISKIFFVHIF